MQVFLRATGMLGKYLGTEPIPVELDDMATLEDLLIQVGRDLAHLFPGHLWNKQEQRFRGPVVISIDKKVARDLCVKLYDGQEIQLVKAFVGG